MGSHKYLTSTVPWYCKETSKDEKDNILLILNQSMHFHCGLNIGSFIWVWLWYSFHCAFLAGFRFLYVVEYQLPHSTVKSSLRLASSQAKYVKILAYRRMRSASNRAPLRGPASAHVHWLNQLSLSHRDTRQSSIHHGNLQTVRWQFPCKPSSHQAGKIIGFLRAPKDSHGACASDIEATSN